MDRRTKIAVVITVIYLVAFSLITGWRFKEVLELPLNEIGDFLAGAFGPLALAWLVFGYFQQGDELRQGTEALRIQGDELKNSVEQQHRIAEISLQALEFEREVRVEQEKRLRASLRPILTLDGGDPKLVEDVWMIECNLVNDGAKIFDVQVYVVVDGVSEYLRSMRVLENGASKKLNITWKQGQTSDDLTVQFRYSEQDGYKNYCSFMALSSSEFGAVAFLNLDQN